ncbi:MAG: hypothetical protein REI64_17200 [Pedobacter sp.]|uniref:hypothetical protein n=1 Tax=Pedobacter sp. TaxID=1411316 RepID=UPI002807526B|nr:hypothetical protein [Pedobacter sp.]MDQ8006543.1 hypothetical protein [Pedobacter sp.]
MIVNHQLLDRDFFIPSWKVKHLFLGTFNPYGGKSVAYFYGREKNFTWNILSKIFTSHFNRNNINELLPLLKQNKIACMDMIRSVNALEEFVPGIIGEGYRDSKIINRKINRNYNTLFINEVIRKNPGIKVYSTWGKGSTLKSWIEEVSSVESNVISLASPSPAARVPKGTEKYNYVLNNWQTKIQKF